MQKKLMSTIIVVSTLAIPFLSSGTNLVANGDAESGTANWQGVTLIAAEENYGTSSFELTGTFALSREFIPIDVSKSYRLSGDFKNLGNEQGEIYFGLAYFDRDRLMIRPEHVNVVFDSETVLVAPASVNDSVVKIKDGTKWRALPLATVAFEVDDSGKYRDLPNRQVTERGISEVTEKGDHWEVKLAHPLTKAYPTGTMIRQHNAGNNHAWARHVRDHRPEDGWTTLDGVFNGEAVTGMDGDRFWNSTAYARVIILNVKKARLVFDNIKLEAIE